MVMNHHLNTQNQTESSARTSMLSHQDNFAAHKYVVLPEVVVFLKKKRFGTTVSVDFKIMRFGTLFKLLFHNSDGLGLNRSFILIFSRCKDGVYRLRKLHSQMTGLLHELPR